MIGHEEYRRKRKEKSQLGLKWEGMVLWCSVEKKERETLVGRLGCEVKCSRL